MSDRDIVWTLDLPGLEAEDVSIEVQDNQLTVRGERPQPQIADGSTYVYAQRPFGAFEHRIALPRGVDADAITATMTNGVLSLIVPKPEPLKPKRVAISGGADRQIEAASA